MPSDFLKEISDLKDQISHFEAAIAALENPKATPTGNALADILAARFAAIDSDEERAKSLKAAQTLLQETKQKLEVKEKFLQRTRDTLQARKNAMSETGRQINRLSTELRSLLEALQGHEQAIFAEWKVFAGDTPMINWSEFALPKFVELTGDGPRYQVTTEEK